MNRLLQFVLMRSFRDELFGSGEDGSTSTYDDGAIPGGPGLKFNGQQLRCSRRSSAAVFVTV